MPWRRSREIWRLGVAMVVMALIGAWSALRFGDEAATAVMTVLSSRFTAPASETAKRFDLCGGWGRWTCIVDGDTFWLDGVKVRVADIDTPEISAPKCAAERAHGLRATQRLRDLMNAGPFTLESVERDADRYGRQLRRVMRAGQSLGDVLVREGLARHWTGRAASWCDGSISRLTPPPASGGLGGPGR